MRRCVRLALTGLAWLVIVPSAAHAQAFIVGVVKDTPGAVLPGVTVEAASPVLIEKTRSVATDGTGQYRIENLRPGTYTIPRLDVLVSGTFQSLPGPKLDANYIATNAVVAPSLGRNLSGNAANVTVSLMAPETLYGKRMNQLDLRIGKILKVRPNPRDHQSRSLQRVECKPGSHREQRVCHLAAASEHSERPLRQGRRAARLLTCRDCCRASS